MYLRRRYYCLPNVSISSSQETVVAMVSAVSIHLTLRCTSKCQHPLLQPAGGSRGGDSQTPQLPALLPQAQTLRAAAWSPCISGSGAGFPSHVLGTHWQSPDPCSCQGSDLRGLRASCPGLFTSHPGGSPGSVQLGGGY